ncbi:MAG: preprotein translocase subunit SecE [Lachnospiraceae bacterium]|nr:preprotein translocase subunit SecE [Lachnospiraceae bacterium]
MGETAQTEKKGFLKSFFKGVKSELKKISWPDKNSLFKQSIAVVAISVVVGLLITLMDTVIQYGVNFLSM